MSARKMMLLYVAFVLVIGAGVFRMAAGDRPLTALEKEDIARQRDEDRTPHPDTVTYVVEYTEYDYLRGGSVSITSENGTGGSEQEDATSLPWRKEFTPEPGQFLYLSAAKTSDHDPRAIGVSILVNGKVVRHASSNAQFGIASVSARMP